MGDIINPKDLNIPDNLKKYLTESGTDKFNYEIIDLEIQRAEGQAKAKLGNVLSLPLDTAISTNQYIMGLVVDITIWRLFKRSPSAKIPESVQVSYEEAVKELEKIAKGMQGTGTDDVDAIDEQKPSFIEYERG